MIYNCTDCSYRTNKKNHYERHLQSVTHQKIQEKQNIYARIVNIVVIIKNNLINIIEIKST